MASKPKSLHLSRPFAHPVAAVWPTLSDTARFNEAADLPKHIIEEIPQPDGSVRYFARAKKGPFPLAWEEQPVNWVAHQWFEHRRDFTTGPLTFLTAKLEMEKTDAGCLAHFDITAAPRNALGQIILATGFFPAVRKIYEQLFDDAERIAAQPDEHALTFQAPQQSAALKKRIDEMGDRVEASGHGHGLTERLTDLIATAQEVDLVHLRPLRLAKLWNVPPRQAIELCLEATRSGLLAMRWDLLCPRCRIPKAATSALDELPTGTHCDTCNIDYDREFSRNVEISFNPDPSIRSILAGEYCLFGPISTPHILAQVALSPGEEKLLPADLPPGAYRFRSLEPGPQVDFSVEGSDWPQLILTENGFATQGQSRTGHLQFVNKSQRSLIAIVEERDWVHDALTADRVTSLQAFRDLFSDQILRPGDEVAIGHVTILFSDLRSSTELFDLIGDAAAYHLVRDHFAFLAGIVRCHNGAIVKTIGDAIMASFAEPSDGLKAALEIQETISTFNAESDQEAIVIKLGLHSGPCIAVTLNDRLDYFGATVNLAARLQGESQGGDIVISENLACDPLVADLIESVPQRQEDCQLKGFRETSSLIRLQPA
ncbi:MAG: adenylate/guanylate cyclase domain-containing protein [Pseudomonadota bacterium]